MPKRELSKCRDWERERRDRLKTCFTALGRLLPCYDPSVVLSKLEILQRAAGFIEDLQRKNKELVQGNCNAVSAQQNEDLLKFQDRVKKLLSRNEQLANLLRDAGLKVPTECGNVRTFREPLLWSNRITPERAKQLRNKLLERKSKDTEKKPSDANQKIKRKRKVRKKKEGASSEKKTAIKQPIKKKLTPNAKTIIRKKKLLNGTSITNTPCPLKATKMVPTSTPVTVLGPGTLILTNGNVVPVLPPVQQIRTILTPTAVGAALVSAQPSVILMRQHSMLPTLCPKIATGITRTTTVNKVPIPALSSRHALTSFVQRQQNSSNNSVVKKKAKKGATNSQSSMPVTVSATVTNTNGVIVTTPVSTVAAVVSKNEPACPKSEAEVIRPNKKLATSEPASHANVIVNKPSVSVSYTIDSLCETSNAPSGQIIELPSVTQSSTVVEEKVIVKNVKQTIDRSEPNLEDKLIEKQDIVREKVASPLLTHPLPVSPLPVSHPPPLPLPPPSPPIIPVSTALTARIDTIPLRSDSSKVAPPPHSELSNDIFASLQVPTGGQHPESMSPTAAFLLAFPLVSTLNGGRVTEVLVEDTPDSRQGTPTTLLQIGGPLDTTQHQTQRQPAPSRQPTPPHLLISSLDGFSFFSSATKDTQPDPNSRAPNSYDYQPRACVFEPKKAQVVVTSQCGAYNPFADVPPVPATRAPPLYTSCTGNYVQYPLDELPKEEKRLKDTQHHQQQQQQQQQQPHRAPVNWMTDIRQPNSEFFLPSFIGPENTSYTPVPEQIKRPTEFNIEHHESNQCSWPTSKQPAPPPPPPTTSLPTLVGDLALGVERPFADPLKQQRSKDETVGSFLSVNQLMEHAGAQHNKAAEQQPRHHRKHNHQQQQQQHQPQQTRGHKRHRDKNRQQDYSMDCHQMQVPSAQAPVLPPHPAPLNRSHRSSYTAEALISSNQQMFESVATPHQYTGHITDQQQSYHTSQQRPQPQQRQQFSTSGFNYTSPHLPPPVELTSDFGALLPSANAADGFGHTKVPSTYENYAGRGSTLTNTHRSPSSSASYRTPSAAVEEKRRHSSKKMSGGGQSSRYHSALTVPTTSTNCETSGISSFPDLGFLSMAGAIASPILPDEFHTSFLTNSTVPSAAPYHSTTSAGPAVSGGPQVQNTPLYPPPLPPTHHFGGRQANADLQPSGSLTNFNLSAIFPEINKPSARASRSQSTRHHNHHHLQQQLHQRPVGTSPVFPGLTHLTTSLHHHVTGGVAPAAGSKPTDASSSASPSFSAFGGAALPFSGPSLPFARH